MNKKFYVTPEMEELNIKIEAVLLDVSYGGGDPTINPVEPDPEQPIILDD